jgi:hypothetical protein
MKHLLILLSILAFSNCTEAQASHEGSDSGRSSYEKQQDTYRQHGYDTYRNGPLPEAYRPSNIERDNRELERQQRDTAEQTRRGTYGQPYGDTGGQTRRGY